MPDETTNHPDPVDPPASEEETPSTEEIPAEILDQLPDEVKENPELVSTFMALRMVKGPLMPPEYLDAYEKYYPGCTRRLIEDLLAHAAHKRDLNLMDAKVAERATMSNIKRADRQPFIVLVVALAMIGAAFYAIGTKQASTATGIIVALCGTGLVSYAIDRIRHDGGKKSPQNGDTDKESP
ncbi:MAG TPA: hypothetical protein VNI20_08140 [Fimbriimonadaceae bacterium]|nr:hypothetical protein [Fimbriimonadaceae bacterium]